jgi:hypothetical protein
LVFADVGEWRTDACEDEDMCSALLWLALPGRAGVGETGGCGVAWCVDLTAPTAA